MPEIKPCFAEKYLKNGQHLPEMLDLLRTHQMQQIKFRNLKAQNESNFDGRDTLSAFWNNYVKCAVYRLHGLGLL